MEKSKGMLLQRLFKKESISQSAGIVVAFTLAQRIIQVVRGIVFARLLGPESYGVYTLAFFLIPIAVTLAKMGVPMIYPGPGIDHVELGSSYGREQNDRYLSERYHMPTDEFDDTWDLSGAVADVQLYYAVGEAVANGEDWPNWNEGTEFRAARDASRGSGG